MRGIDLSLLLSCCLLLGVTSAAFTNNNLRTSMKEQTRILTSWASRRVVHELPWYTSRCSFASEQDRFLVPVRERRTTCFFIFYFYPRAAREARCFSQGKY